MKNIAKKQKLLKVHHLVKKKKFIFLRLLLAIIKSFISFFKTRPQLIFRKVGMHPSLFVLLE